VVVAMLMSAFLSIHDLSVIQDKKLNQTSQMWLLQFLLKIN